MKVRIKKKTKPGDQVDYSLATGNMYGHINADAYDYNNPMINDTLKQVPKEDANIEAERGETIIGDFNQDGLLEHSKVGGKRHHEGGTFLNVPNGSFVFSDTKKDGKLKIKDKDVQEYFGKKYKKEGYTPAQLAKPYDLNKYNAVLKDPKASKIEKDTAMKMIEDNTRKLSELALLQESMKGMPNGIPSFVESVMGEPTEARKGGPIIHMPIPMQEGGDKKRPAYTYNGRDLRNYGMVGRGAHYVLNDTYEAGKNLLYHTLHKEGFLNQSINKAGIAIEDVLYDLFLNPYPSTPDKQIEIVDPNKNKNPNFGIQRTNADSTKSTKRKVSLTEFQDGGDFKDEIVDLDGRDVISRVYKNGTKVLLEMNGKILASKPAPQSTSTDNSVKENKTPAPQYTQYGNKTFSKILEEQDKLGKVKWAKQDFGTFSSQSRQGNTGLYGRTDYDWEDFKSRHGDWIETEYGDHGGVEGFLRDIQDPTKSKVATKWFQDKVNEKSMKKFGAKYFTPENGSPYGSDGLFGPITYSTPNYFQDEPVVEVADKPKESVPETKVATNTKVEDKIKPGVPFDNELTRPRDERMYLEDQLGILSAMTDRVNTYMPQRQQVDLVSPEATYLDPSRQVAAMQEQAARFQDLSMNTADGQVARANVLGSSGQSSAQVADVLANYENQNVQIANQNAMQVADVENRERLTNTELNAKYIQELATTYQNRDNAMRQLKANRYAQVINGIKNRRNKKMFEQVLFPQVSTDSITGDWYTVNGRNLMDVVQTYGNPGVGTSQDPTATAFDLSRRMVEMKNSLIAEGMSKEDAEWATNNSMRMVKPNMDTADQLFRQQLLNLYLR